MSESGASNDCVGKRGKSIAEMEPGYFWARPSAFGTTDEETKAMAAGLVSPERVTAFKEQVEAAKAALYYATPAGIDHGFRTAIN